MRPESTRKVGACKLPLSEPPRVRFSGDTSLTPSLPQAHGSPSSTFPPHSNSCPTKSHHALPSDE